MKGISLNGRERVPVVMLLAILGGSGACQPLAPPPEDGAGGGTEPVTLSDQEVSAAIRKAHPLMSDIPPIPIPEGLRTHQGGYVQEALELLDAVNAFASSNWLSTSSVRLADVKKGTGGWIEESSNPMVVTYTRQDGDLTTTITHVLGLPGQWQWWVTWDGCDGEHRYRDFLVEWWMLTTDGKLMKHDVFQCPDAPSCAAQTGCHESTPLVTWVFETLDEGTLYTLWDEVQLVTRRYTMIHYAYSALASTYSPSTQEVCTHYPDGHLLFESYKRRASIDLLYRWYRGFWTVDYRYCWMTYREDETVLDCGGDAGCPDCGP